MRRQDREVKDLKEITGILGRCDVCHMGLSDGEFPYVVPMSFGYREREGTVSFYFHCASEGRRIDLLKRNPRVCLQFDCGHRLITGEKACDCSTEYESVIAFGTAEFLTGQNEKCEALTHLMQHYEHGQEFSFDERRVKSVTVFKVTAEQISGKRKKVPGKA